jgi:hypothetical protein
LSDAEFDAMLEAQRAEDAKMTEPDQSSFPKRQRNVLTDHEYRLRKERTDNQLAGYKNVLLRRSPRLKAKSIPNDFMPPPPFLDRDHDSDGDDPDSDPTQRRWRLIDGVPWRWSRSPAGLI